jgi:hypothetical protein
LDRSGAAGAARSSGTTRTSRTTRASGTTDASGTEWSVFGLQQQPVADALQ